MAERSLILEQLKNDPLLAQIDTLLANRSFLNTMKSIIGEDSQKKIFNLKLKKIIKVKEATIKTWGPGLDYAFMPLSYQRFLNLFFYLIEPRLKNLTPSEQCKFICNYNLDNVDSPDVVTVCETWLKKLQVTTEINKTLLNHFLAVVLDVTPGTASTWGAGNGYKKMPAFHQYQLKLIYHCYLK